MNKRTTLSFRVRPKLKADVERVALAANRSVSAQIDYLLDRALLYEGLLAGLSPPKTPEELRTAIRTRVAEIISEQEGVVR